MSLISPFKSSQFAHGSEFYEISAQYAQGDSGFSGDYEYFGFTNNVGKWVIQRHQISTGMWLYANGESSFNVFTPFASNLTALGLLNYVYNYQLSDTSP